MLRKRPDAFFLIVGYNTRDPFYGKKLEDAAKQFGITDHVRITAYPGPIADVWSAIDIHVHASLFDSLPNAIIEGMSLGKPAVVTAVGGIPEAVEHGVSGLLIPPGDASALAEALLRFLCNPELARACGVEARKNHSRYYGAETIVRQIESCFLDVVAAHA